jgi:hypothetical protein
MRKSTHIVTASFGILAELQDWNTVTLKSCEETLVHLGINM